MNAVVFFQQYNDCVNYMAHSFSKYSKGSVLHLITDNIGQISEKTAGLSNVEIVELSNYGDTFNRVLHSYKHKSVNPYWFEWPSMVRWCVFDEYTRKNNLKEVFTSDWDVAYYRDIEELASIYRPMGVDFTVTNKMCCGSSFWFNVGALKELSDMIVDFYCNPKSTIQPLLGGNISDMSFINLMFDSGKYKIFDAKNIVEDECMDDNIVNTWDWKSAQPEGAQQGLKDMQFEDGKAYCFNNKLNKKIRINSNHFTNFTRNYMLEMMKKIGVL